MNPLPSNDPLPESNTPTGRYFALAFTVMVLLGAFAYYTDVWFIWLVLMCTLAVDYLFLLVITEAHAGEGRRFTGHTPLSAWVMRLLCVVMLALIMALGFKDKVKGHYKPVRNEIEYSWKADRYIYDSHPSFIKKGQEADSARFRQVNDSLDQAPADKLLGSIKVGSTVFTAMATLRTIWNPEERDYTPIEIGCGKVESIHGLYSHTFPFPFYGVYIVVDAGNMRPGGLTDYNLIAQRYDSVRSCLSAIYGQPHERIRSIVPNIFTEVDIWRFNRRVIVLSSLYRIEALPSLDNQFVIIECSAEGFDDLQRYRHKHEKEWEEADEEWLEKQPLSNPSLKL